MRAIPFIIGGLILILGLIIGANFVNGLILIYRYYAWPEMALVVTWTTLTLDLVMTLLCMAPPLMMLLGLLLHANAKLCSLTDGVRYG